jgi:hypothetical protein
VAVVVIVIIAIVAVFVMRHGKPAASAPKQT